MRLVWCFYVFYIPNNKNFNELVDKCDAYLQIPRNEKTVNYEQTKKENAYFNEWFLFLFI